MDWRQVSQTIVRVGKDWATDQKEGPHQEFNIQKN